MARVSKPTKFGLKINAMIGWILCTPRLSEWSRLGLASLSRRPELGLTWCHSSADPRNSAGFEESSHLSSIPPFFPPFATIWAAETEKVLGRNNNSAELRNQRTYEAYKQFHFHEATSNRRIGSLLWHLGDNKRPKQPKKLTPIPVVVFFFFVRVFHTVRLWNCNSDRLPTPSREIGKKSEILSWVGKSDKGKLSS